MKIMVLVLSIAMSASAFGAFTPKTRDDWRSIEACIRHLKREGASAIPKVLEHLEPMRDSRETVFLKRIRLGSQEEVDLIGRQWTRTGESKDRGAIGKTIIGTTLRYLWNFALDIVDAVLPGCGFLLPVVLVLYLYIRYFRHIINAMYGNAETNLGKGERKKVFTHPDVVKDYDKQAKKGKL